MLSGREIFKLMDTHGLPLEIINEILRERGEAFNVVEFVDAAIESKNFTYEKIRGKLIEAMLPKHRADFTAELDRRYAAQSEENNNKEE